jgi:hypothetical protein
MEDLKQNWEELSKSIGYFNSSIIEFEKVIKDLRTHKSYAVLIDRWISVVDKHNEFDKNINGEKLEV